MDKNGFDIILNSILRLGHGGVSVSYVEDGYGWLAIILNKAKDKPIGTARHKTSPMEAVRMVYKAVQL